MAHEIIASSGPSLRGADKDGNAHGVKLPSSKIIIGKMYGERISSIQILCVITNKYEETKAN